VEHRPAASILTGLVAALAIACTQVPRQAPGSEAMVSRAPTPAMIRVSGVFVKLTGLPCHRSERFVGNETVIFHGSDGSETTIVTHSAQSTGLPAEPPVAPLGQCRQVARYEVDLPVAERYVVRINDHELPPVTLAELEAEGLRHRFLLPS
jgi:hypothetical protein